MAGAIYTGGREGTHGVTMCKPVGGGVIDIENVPLDISQQYLDQGYYQCGGTGDSQQVGYCVPHPANGEAPAGYDCQPAPAKDVNQTATSLYIPPANVNVQPTRMPEVGSGDLSLLLALAGAIVVAVITKGAGKRRRM